MNNNEKREQSKHDPYFKAGLKDMRVSIPFLQNKLPHHILKDMDLKKLEVVSEFLVSERLGHKVVDILFKVPYMDEEAFIYILVEHQSKPDPMMPFRLILYLFLIWDEWRRKKQEKEKEVERQEGEQDEAHATPSKKLPVIFPMVYYNGKEPYSGPMKLEELFENPGLFKQAFNGPMHLIEARSVDEEALKEHTWDFVFEMLMKYIHDDDILDKLLELIPKMMQIEKENGGIDFVVLTFRYLLTSARNCDKEEIYKLVNKLEAARSGIMTVAEQLRQEGRDEMERKVAEAERNCIRALLNTGFNQQKIAETLGLPLARVQTLAREF